jgi:S-adenosylmethionine:tRNA ribosyltransferase-isomerase
VRVADFDYELPADRIAQHPSVRGESRLLVADAPPGARHRTIAELPELLRPGDLLVVNDTRVLKARLAARREPGGGEVELLLAERLASDLWDCLARPGKRARPGARLRLDDGLLAEVVELGPDGRRRVRFSEPIEPHLERIGHVPLPPYINRPDEPADRERYQTVWATAPGAIAAPTAGLHFTPAILEALDRRGVERAAVTLHVGVGTFKPMTADLVHEHVMDAERYEISGSAAAAIGRARAEGRRVVAVGTTVVRTLEGAAQASGAVEAGAGTTSLFVTPGFEFRVVDALLTNFHLPRSTLLLLVAAFAGGRERVLALYREAIAHGYRFYSYGDAMLVERAPLIR